MAHRKFEKILEVEVSVAVEVKQLETVSMLEKTGIAISRYGLAVILLLIGSRNSPLRKQPESSRWWRTVH